MVLLNHLLHCTRQCICVTFSNIYEITRYICSTPAELSIDEIIYTAQQRELMLIKGQMFEEHCVWLHSVLKLCL